MEPTLSCPRSHHVRLSLGTKGPFGPARNPRGPWGRFLFVRRRQVVAPIRDRASGADINLEKPSLPFLLIPGTARYPLTSYSPFFLREHLRRQSSSSARKGGAQRCTNSGRGSYGINLSALDKWGLTVHTRLRDALRASTARGPSLFRRRTNAPAFSLFAPRSTVTRVTMQFS